MTERRDVQFCVVSEGMRLVELNEPPAAYELRSDRGWLWLQRVLFWLLGCIGAYYQVRTRVFTRTEEQNDDLLASIVRQRNQWLRLMRHSDCRLVRVYVGPEQAADLMQLVHSVEMRPLSFTARTRVGLGTHWEWRYAVITVVPWMSGVIMVPADPLLPDYSDSDIEREYARRRLRDLPARSRYV